eukprot:TRINITY_DN615_c0_g3_i1.p1 TRINITY_DN615_c0_g3~~TRINITY_DN615_c0_g3_i1.p1  ORF type:complete len:411 (+),score=82.71 TRINITY_DN615_c0_g3_i1:1569-2801(+)
MMDALPDEVLLLMLQLVDARDLGRVARTCRRLAALANDDALWRLQLSKDLVLPVEKLEKPSWQSWRERWMVCMLPPCRSSEVPPHWPPLSAWSDTKAYGFVSVAIGGVLFVLEGNGVTKYELTGSTDWKQVARIDLAAKASAQEEYISMYHRGDKLFALSLNGRRNLVVLDQSLNELFWTSTGVAAQAPVPLGDRLLVSIDTDEDDDFVELFWLDAPDGRLVPTTVRLPDTMGNLVYVSPNELAYFDMWEANPYSSDTVDRFDVHFLDRELRDTAIQVCVPTTPAKSTELVAVDGRVLVLIRSLRSQSVATLDLVSVHSQQRTHVDLPVVVSTWDCPPTAHEGRLFVPLTSNNPSAQFVVYCFNRGGALLWHGCLPMTPHFWDFSILLIPDGRPVASMWELPDTLLVLDQ